MIWEDREKEELRLDEGFRLKAYKDSRGFFTIGVGHYLGDKPQPAEITVEKAEEWFAEDFEEAVTDTKRVVPFFDALDGARKGALVNMCFNMGASKLSEFHGTLQALDEGDWMQAALRVMNSRYARQVKGRANRIAYRFRTGEYALR